MLFRLLRCILDSGLGELPCDLDRLPSGLPPLTSWMKGCWPVDPAGRHSSWRPGDDLNCKLRLAPKIYGSFISHYRRTTAIPAVSPVLPPCIFSPRLCATSPPGLPLSELAKTKWRHRLFVIFVPWMCVQRGTKGSQPNSIQFSSRSKLLNIFVTQSH